MKIRAAAVILIVYALAASCALDSSSLTIGRTSDAIVPQGKYLLYNEKRFNGLLEDHFENGKLKRQAVYENGLLEGTSKTWYENGAVESERFYYAGEKEGVHRGWWPNGNTRFEYHFADGVYDGEFKEWYESGKPLHRFIYDHGREVAAIGWRENGKTYINFIVRAGRKYGLTNARLCYSLKDEKGIYRSANN